MDAPKNPFESPEPAPEKLGKYVVERELGRGGMGVVYLCRDPDLDRLVAIKVLPETMQSDAERLRRFREEAKSVARLAHPNIVSIYGIERSDTGALLYVMEYVEGENLSRTLKTRRLEPVESLKICVQIARAIAAAHAEGIWHRDIKPGNIMLTRDHAVKVLDFGLAKRDRSIASTSGSLDEDVTATFATNPGQIIGTPGYMSPEQIYGKGVDHRTDIFSFGAVLYVCITGEHAFSGETTMHIITNTCHVEPSWDRLSPEVPQRLHDLIRQCLAKDKEDRLNDIQIAVAELEAVLAERSTGISSFASMSPGVGNGFANAPSRTINEDDIEVVRELTPGVTRIQRVRLRSDPSSGTYIRKVVEPDMLLMSKDAAEEMCREFVQRARVQQKAAQADPNRWAPVYAMGGPGISSRSGDARSSLTALKPPSAFYVTDDYASSLASVIEDRRLPDHRQLHRIVSGIVGGLLSLKRAQSREHGRLQPANVLLTDENLTHTRAVLADPAAQGELGSDSRASGAGYLRPDAAGQERRVSGRRDFTDLGRIIYQLVMQQPPPARLMAVPESSEWRRLKPAAEEWRKLCEDLLNPAYRGTLEEVKERLDRMPGVAPTVPLWKRIDPRLARRLAAAAAVLVVLVVGAMVISQWSKSVSNTVASNGQTARPNGTDGTLPPGFEAAYWNWARSISRPSEQSSFEAVIREQPALLSAVSQIFAEKLAGETVQEPPRVPLPLVASGIVDVKQTLRDWLGEVTQDLDSLGQWSSTGERIRQAVDRIRFALHAGEVLPERERVDLVVEFGHLPPRFRESIQELTAQRATFDEAVRSLPVPTDPVLTQLEDAASRQFRQATSLDALGESMREWTNLAARIERTLGPRWDHAIDYQHFKDTCPAYEQLDRGAFDIAYFESWLACEKPSPVPKDDDPRTFVELPSPSTIENTYREFCMVAPGQPAPVLDQLLTRLSEIERERADLVAVEWTGARSVQARVEELLAAHHDSVKAFTDQFSIALGACGEDCDKELANLALASIDSDSTHLQEVWSARGRALLARGDEDDSCIVRLHNAKQEREILQGVHSRTAWSPPDVLDRLKEDSASRVRRIVRDMREASLRDVLPASSDPIRADEVERAINEKVRTFEQWKESADAVLSNALDVVGMLDEAFGLDELNGQWPPRGYAYDDLRSVPIIEFVDRRFDSLANLPESRDQLVQVVADPDAPPELRRAAWQRMGTVGIEDPQALADEQQVQRPLETMYASLSHARAERLRGELDNGRRDRWFEHVRQMPEPNDQWFEDIAALMSSFGVDWAALTALPPHFRFSFELHRLKETVRGGDGEAIEDGVREIKAWIEEHEDVRGLALARMFLDELNEVLGLLEADDDARTMDAADWAEVGPGLAGWKPLPGATGEYVIYCPPDWNCSRDAAGEYVFDPGTNSAWPNSQPLVFREVTKDDEGVSSWVCTTEFTVGLFKDLVNRDGLAKGVRDMMREDRRGPRAWDPSPAGFGLAGTWLLDEQPRRELRTIRVSGADMVVRQQRVPGEPWAPFEGLPPTYLVDVPRPSADHPLQHVSVAAAAYLADLLNCRFPTLGERMAAAVQSDGIAADTPNLRDQTWLMHFQQWKTMHDLVVEGADPRNNRAEVRLREIGNQDHVKQYPIDGPSDGAWGATELVRDNAIEDGHDDGVLWFRPIDRAALLNFQNLVGNVWEFALPDDLPQAAREGLMRPGELSRNTQAVVQTVREHGPHVQVMGGSALSHPRMGTGAHPLLEGRPSIPARIQQTYADVGLRLAFSANVGPDHMRRLQAIVRDQRYLLAPD